MAKIAIEVDIINPNGINEKAYANKIKERNKILIFVNLLIDSLLNLFFIIREKPQRAISRLNSKGKARGPKGS